MLRQLSAVAASAAFITLLGSGCSTPQPIVRNYLMAEPTRDAKLLSLIHISEPTRH